MTAKAMAGKVMATNRSPWREPMVWLVVALPAASIVAGIVLLVLAGGPGSSDVVPDEVRRTAQVQVADLGPDERAQALGLSAVVRSGDGIVAVLPVAGRFDRNAPLRLQLRHPARADLDRSVALVPDADGWHGAARIDASHDWNVQLQSGDGRWRLQGRLPRGQRAAYLQPLFGEGR